MEDYRGAIRESSTSGSLSCQMITKYVDMSLQAKLYRKVDIMGFIVQEVS